MPAISWPSAFPRWRTRPTARRCSGSSFRTSATGSPARAAARAWSPWMSSEASTAAGEIAVDLLGAADQPTSSSCSPGSPTARSETRTPGTALSPAPTPWSCPVSDPDELVRLAGTVLEAEAVYATEDGVWSGRASLTYRHRAKVDANSIRQLGVGEAVIVSRGRAARLLVLLPTAQPTDPRHPARRQPSRSARPAPPAGG